MRIKHWQGYGCLNATCTSKQLNTQTHTKVAVVKVVGNHEYGLDRSRYKEDAAKWLSKVIKDTDLNAGLALCGPDGYNFSCRLKCTFRYLPDENGEETAEYTFEYPFKW